LTSSKIFATIFPAPLIATRFKDHQKKRARPSARLLYRAEPIAGKQFEKATSNFMRTQVTPSRDPGGPARISGVHGERVDPFFCQDKFFQETVLL